MAGKQLRINFKSVIWSSMPSLKRCCMHTLYKMQATLFVHVCHCSTVRPAIACSGLFPVLLLITMQSLRIVVYLYICVCCVRNNISICCVSEWCSKSFAFPIEMVCVVVCVLVLSHCIDWCTNGCHTNIVVIH